MKNMKYKMLATDLDGTVLDKESNLSEYTVSVLRAIDEAGVKVVICTGRPYQGALQYLRQIGLKNPGVFCNGAQVRVLDGEILRETPLPIEEAKLVIRLGEENGAHPRVYLGDELYVSHANDEDKVYASRSQNKLNAVGDLCAFLDRQAGAPLTGEPLKVINSVPSQELIPILLEKNARIFKDRLYITQSLSINGMMFMEYMNASATKGGGVTSVAAMYGILADETVVAGDHLNDLTMFETAGFSIAPRNAHKDVLAAASEVCLSNTEDGVAKKLAEMFL